MTLRCLAPLLLACVTLLAAHPPSLAAEFQVSADPENKCSAVEVTGEIRPGDELKFKSAVGEAAAQAPLRRLYLNSGGGDFLTSTLIWGAIRTREPPVETIVRAGQQCNSACILLLAAGERRNVSAAATIVLHQARHSVTNEPSYLGTLTYGYYLVESGLSDELLNILRNLKPEGELVISAANATKSGFGAFHFFGGTNPPATRGCAWQGFLPAYP